MKYFLAAVIMSALVFTLATPSAHAEICGAYSKAETDDSEVAAAANFAIKAREKALRKDDKDAIVSLVEIISASKQVVAGINYKIRLKVNINYKDQIVEVVVFKKLSDEYELTSWEYKPVKKKESENSL
ncbi:MAG: cystatin domain-containing protein [Victivallales bacterium]|jgi:hypothetical protein